jgi:hypothetical protein
VVGLTAGLLQTPRSRALRRVAPYVAGAAVAAAVYLFDDELFAWPIVVATGLLGGGLAFALLVVPYGAVSYHLTQRVLRWEARRDRDREPTRLMRLLTGEDTPHGRVAGCLLRGGSFVGFGLASVFAGGILTSWFLQRQGRRDMTSAAVLSNVLFAVGFVGTYAGLFGWLVF